MSDQQPERLFPTGGEWDTGNVYLKIGDEHHDTGLRGHWNGNWFTVPFHDEMTAEECARIISRALTREEDTNGTK